MVNKLSPKVLRTHKGISFTGVTTVFLCHDGKGRILLAKRSANTRDEQGRWDPGGGGLKHGEAVEDNMRRELKEEYNVDPIKSGFVGYFDAFRQTPTGEPTHWIAMCFVVLVDPNKVKINEPKMNDDFGWFYLNKLPSPMHSQFDVLLSKHGKKIKAIVEDKKA